MKANKKYFIVGIVLTLILAVAGVTYAYWRGVIKGNGSSISLSFDSVSIIFTDNTEIAETNAKPGWSTTKTFTIENQGTVPFKYDIYIKNFLNTLVTEGYLQYKITSTNGYNMTEYKALPKTDPASDIDLATNIVVEAGATQEYTIEIRYENDPNFDQSEDIGKTFNGQLMIRENTSVTLYDKILADHPTVNTRSSFSSVFGETVATTGVIYKEDIYKEDTSTGAANNKDVYYFAGNVSDNWVKFGEYYWRIIRTNEDGGIRLLYHGTSTTATNSYIATNFAYNTSYNNTMYVGYMYGSTGNLNSNRNNTNSSQMKTKLEEWYGSNLASYDNAVSKTAIYCNDRSGDAYASSGTMYHAAYKRLINNKRPTYKCGGNAISTSLYGDANVADRFSVSDKSGGNGKLTHPIGLITADEVAFAGGVWDTNAPNTYYYLNSSGGSSTGQYWWWTISPYGAFSGNTAGVFIAYGSSYPGHLTYTGTHNASSSDTAAVRPVISLKSCVLVSKGNGTAGSPYEIEVSSTCAGLDN